MEINPNDYMRTMEQLDELLRKVSKYEAAVKHHHDQKADDRCHFDDDQLYQAFGLPPADYAVGDKEAMLANCERFINKRCESGKWPTYVELEEKIQQMEEQYQRDQEKLRHFDYLILAVPLVYKEGFRDYGKGICRNDNPYSDGTGRLESLEGKAWDAGWMLRNQRQWNRTENKVHKDWIAALEDKIASLQNTSA